eukprot:TRINITY_DN10276_c0_g1_i1.p1 TRINITY_DN10276_c0_g1~~TRINITY_DN10276_c0_g1_i1.p1  ORF type:complete len:697 (+),score=128.52 TRINITY_DN10276_c0_g1_i1:148-2238(+)
MTARSRDEALLDNAVGTEFEMMANNVSSAAGSEQSAVAPEQLHGEVLSNDPEWPMGWWPVAYLKMHKNLVEKAQAIQHEELMARAERDTNAGQEAPSVAASLRLLRKEVFALCPVRFLYGGIMVSCVLTTLSFTVPLVKGRLVDVTVAAFRRHEVGEAVDISAVIGPYLIQYGLLLFGGYVCEIAVGILFAIVGHTTVTRLRIKLFRNLVIQEIAFYDKHVSGELSSRLINDSAALSSLTQFTTQTLLGAIVKFVGSLIAMYMTHPYLALLATFITPVNTYLAKRTGKSVGYYGVVQNFAMAKANAVAIEVLGSIRTVQANVGEVEEGNRFMRHLNYYLRVIKATVYIETVLRLTQYGLSRLRDVLVLGVAMQQIIVGNLTIGNYTAFASYVDLYEDGFRSIADIWINFKQTITSTGKFVQLLLRQAEIHPVGGLCPISCSGSLSLQNVWFFYESRPDKMVLRNLSINATPGSIIALVGESGAGKSTLGRLLLRYYDPTQGKITLDGVDYTSLNLRWLRAQLGFVEQEPVLFDRALKDNIAYGSSAGKSIQDIRKAAELSNAHAFICNLAQDGSDWQDGYDVHPGERAARISGGQKQRVAIARAVIRDPKVLLLDEATSALDSENEHVVQQALDNLMEGKTTFIIAHRLSTVVRATKILVLDKGNVVEHGTHEELTKLDGKYASFMKHQLVKPLLE